MLFRSVLVMMFGVCSFGELGDAVQGILCRFLVIF